MSATVRDIAAAAKVSPATVSRVFARHPNVKSEIRERVKAEARRLNYSPKLRKSCRNVAVITHPPREYSLPGYSNMIINSLANEFAERNYRMELIPLQNIDMLCNSHICGAVAIPYDIQLDNKWNDNFDLPLIHINSFIKASGNIYTICSDDEQGMELAVSHLHKNNHRSIGLIIYGSPDGEVKTHRTYREKGFRKAMVKYGLPVNNYLIRYISSSDNLYEQIGHMLQSDVTAIITSGETHGLKTAYILNLFGKRIPHDISLLTYEWKQVSECCMPPQTTLAQDIDAMSRQAVNILERNINDEETAHNIFVDYHLIERESVRDILH